ncbi:MarR family transcriptional regulator [Aquibium carbonis]|uniref:MarR family transcriptional regulator n=2 Tax=Aquibium carbonis TaxID=2495581 RepID=A0A3R9YVL0_9HYPH|nr:MarR family transcriptional regulator [Aquibium carbonis]
MEHGADEAASLELENFLPYRLNRLAEAVSRDFQTIYRTRHGLTRPEWRLLASLGQHGTMTATEVGRDSAMHKTKVSRAVSALEERRWLKRETDPEDRRVERLALTPVGAKAYAELVPLARRFEADLLRTLAPAERKALSVGLAAIERRFVGG